MLLFSCLLHCFLLFWSVSLARSICAACVVQQEQVLNCCRVRRGVQAAVLQDALQEAVPLLLQQVLRQVPVRAAGHLRQQGHLPLLQQLEDQERRAQVPMMGHAWAFQFLLSSRRPVSSFLDNLSV
jgi:hypothetical protein